jgi:putative glutamine amidotransferase
MAPRIAIPVPHSGDRAYAERALPQYEEAVRKAGGEPVRISLDGDPGTITQALVACDAVLLPGSKADVDPEKYGAQKDPRTAAADVKRDAVDELVLQHAYHEHKPVLGICYGLQILNVHRHGTLLQHIESSINHEAGRAVALAHEVEIEPGSLLAKIVGVTSLGHVPVNSSHHQSADAVGEGLRVVAHSPTDGVVEAIEGTSPEHFVLGVQWHPERSVDEAGPLGDSARAIFRSFIERARERQQNL